jgi:hypothetical protein
MMKTNDYDARRDSHYGEDEMVCYVKRQGKYLRFWTEVAGQQVSSIAVTQESEAGNALEDSLEDYAEYAFEYLSMGGGEDA